MDLSARYMNLVRNILAWVGIITICVLCVMLGKQRSVPPQIVHDTIVVEKPVPYAVETIRKEYVYVHTPADTIVKETIRVDSVLVAVDIERREYQDSLYRAVVSGAVVGDIHPSLDHIDIYSRSETRVIKHAPPMFRPYIRGSVGQELMGIGGGVSIKDRVDVDVQYMRMGNRNMVVVGANYRFNIEN